MTISLDDVRRIARLARIEITPHEVADVHAKLASVFRLIDELQALDTDGLEPLAHALDSNAPLRDDVVTASDCRELFQRTAPLVEHGLYLVPKVID